ncbi:MAG TPA: efflux RND transporter periplasmic adaptor subunit, partial [Bacteroidales bacterium]|nr:efflux RND transporter periplasmic adaptor subunit [Bacteroidales bacterium]
MKKRRIMLRIGIGLVALVIVFLAVARKQGWIGKQHTTSVTIEEVKRRTIVEIVSASGKIQPEVEVKISPDLSGEVVELPVNEGDQVTKGQLLARINPEIYLSNYDRIVASLNMQQANLANARARLAQVQAQFINAKTNHDRNQILFQQQAISQSEFDSSRANFLVAQAEVEAAEQSIKAAQYSVRSAEAAVKEARENLTKTSIFAPMDGTVSKLSIERGERVVGTSQFAGTEIMRVANLASMEVVVSVAENDIVRVSLNDTALIDVDAYIGRQFKGVVTSIATSATLTGVTADQVANFDVRILILPESYSDLLAGNSTGFSPFRPGMSAAVDIQTRTEAAALSVPIQAVTSRPDTLEMQQTGYTEPALAETSPRSTRMIESVF